MYRVQCTMYSVERTIYSVQYIMYIVHCTVYNVKCTMYSVHCTMYRVQCRVQYFNLHPASETQRVTLLHPDHAQNSQDDLIIRTRRELRLCDDQGGRSATYTISCTPTKIWWLMWGDRFATKQWHHGRMLKALKKRQNLLCLITLCCRYWATPLK